MVWQEGRCVTVRPSRHDLQRGAIPIDLTSLASMRHDGFSFAAMIRRVLQVRESDGLRRMEELFCTTIKEAFLTDAQQLEIQPYVFLASFLAQYTDTSNKVLAAADVDYFISSVFAIPAKKHTLALSLRSLPYSNGISNLIRYGIWR